MKCCLPSAIRYGLMILAAVAFAAAPLRASAEPSRWAPREWALGVGVFDLAKSDRVHIDVSARFEPIGLGFRLFGRPVELEPALGFLVHVDGGYYGYHSLRFPFRAGERWRLVPYSGLGIYSAGDGKDLGGPVEFRSGLEVASRLGERWYLGLEYSHLSNAVLYDRNPGAETLQLTFSFRP